MLFKTDKYDSPTVHKTESVCTHTRQTSILYQEHSYFFWVVQILRLKHGFRQAGQKQEYKREITYLRYKNNFT